MKRFVATFMTLCLMLGMLCVPAFAANTEPSVPGSFTVTTSGKSGTVPVQITTSDGGLLVFKVSLPTALPAYVDAHNQVYTADDAFIVNLSAGPVEVTSLALYSANGWDIVAYGTDLGSRPVGEKTVSMVINELKSTDGSRTGNHINYNQSTFMRAFRAETGASYLWSAQYNSRTGVTTPSDNGIMSIDYDIEIAPQGRSLYSETVSNAIFTVAFAYA